MATSSHETLDVYVIGSGVGESIVLGLPGGKWGVVDCFASSQANPTVQLLERCGAAEIEFLCLTHPHHDHYYGMSQVLERFPVRSFCAPAIIDPRTLRWLLKASKMDALRSGDDGLKEEMQEFERILRLVKTQEKRRGIRVTRMPCTSQTKVFPFRVEDANAPVSILAIAPAGNQIDNYQSKLAKCFDGNRLLDTNPKIDHNQISIALLLVFGQTRIVLGGDVERAAWSDALAVFTESISAQLVKVSHHGSRNGHSTDLWKKLSRRGKPIATLTPYYSKGLPDTDALLHVGEFASRIDSACQAAVYGEDVSSMSEISLPSRLALRAKNKARRGKPFSIGQCRYKFNANGECIESSYEGAAGIV